MAAELWAQYKGWAEVYPPSRAHLSPQGRLPHHSVHSLTVALASSSSQLLWPCSFSFRTSTCCFWRVYTTARRPRDPELGCRGDTLYARWCHCCGQKPTYPCTPPLLPLRVAKKPLCRRQEERIVMVSSTKRHMKKTPVELLAVMRAFVLWYLVSIASCWYQRRWFFVQ